MDSELEQEAPVARILMVDDHPPNLIALEAILQPLGQELIKVTSGEAALRELLEGDFALILMDVQMPGLDGLQTAKLIKDRKRNSHIPIIFLTAIHKDPSYIFRGYREGAVDYMLKPFDPEILRAKVSVFVELWKRGEIVRQQQAMLRARELIELEKRGELRFRAVTDSMPQCVWAARADGTIYYCNQVWKAYVGADAASFLDAVPEEELAGVREAWRQAIASGKSLEREQRLERHDGELRWHLLRMVPEREENGSVRGWICTATDIHEQKKLLAVTQEARHQAEVANRTKDEFLATVSHELRTPLNAILGWTRMLRSGAVEQRSLQRVLETIERNARAQTQLVDDILDVSRIIAGKMRVNIRKADLHVVTRSALEAVRPAAEAKGVELVAEFGPDSNEFYGDPDRLQQVIWNLVSNAIKFTPRDGRVEVRVDRVASHVEISVTDTGMGIRKDLLQQVFNRFWQADSSITRAQGGLGLGLAIVRHLVEVHGGTVQAFSEGEGKGAKFVVRLPVRAVAPVFESEESSSGNGRQLREPGAPPPPQPQLLHGVEVLVVDDESDARELITAVLTSAGADVRSASSVDEAISMLRHRRPDVLISDIGLPSEDGYGLIRRVREIDALLPAAALTAFASIDDHKRALEAGFQAHVTKPIEPGDLALLVASLARSSTPASVPRVEPHAVAG